MSNGKQSFWSKLEVGLVKLAASNYFFGLVLGGFLTGASWIAFSALYPGAFDEDTHLGLIKYFSAHPNPFLNSQPVPLDVFGPVAHSPQYLYYIFMILPWRLITFLTANQTSQIICLRLFNLGLFATGILLFKQVLLKVTDSRALVHLVLAIFMLVPITSQLAAQINYDNLVLPLLAFDLLLAIGFLGKLKDGKFDITKLTLFMVVGLIASLVKYAYLTIFAAAFLYIAWLVVHRVVKHKLNVSKIRTSFSMLGSARKILLVLALLVSLGLFFESYGLNLVRYHTPLPKCVQVIGPDRCNASSIYRREIIYSQSKPAVFNRNLVYFGYAWAKHMLFNDTMAINVASSGYAIGLPLPLPYLSLVFIFILGVAATILLARKTFAKPAVNLFGFICLAYLVSLLALNYSSYLQAGRRVAVQGRYLVPLLPMLLFIFLSALNLALQKLPRSKVYLASVTILCLLLGGGALTFILHSDNSWYRPSQTVISANQTVKTLVRPIIPGSGYKPFVQSSLEF